MNIFDLRDCTIKVVKREHLNCIAPECYMFVQEVKKESHLNHTVEYVYKLTNNRKLRWIIPSVELKIHIPFKEREDLFLKANNINRIDILEVERYWYIDKETINYWR